MKPYKKIVVTTDLSPLAACAFEHASTIAKAYGSELILLYVIEDPSLSKSFKFPGQAVAQAAGVYKQDENKVREQLEQLADSSFDGQKVKIEILKTGKSPDLAILDFLAETEASLLVVSSNGRTGLRRAVIGSIAEKLSRGSTCPVLLVKN